MKKLTLPRSSFTLLLSAALFSTAATARADDIYTYQFAANSGQPTIYDGSWFTYNATTGQATDWDIIFSILGGTVDLTPAVSSSAAAITSADPSSFIGAIDFGQDDSPVVEVDAHAVGSGTPSSDSLDVSGADFIEGSFDNGTALGTWSRSSTAPDAASSLGLLGGCFGALAWARSKVRRA